MRQRVGSYQTLNVRMSGPRPSSRTQLELEKLRPTGCRALAIFLRSLQAGGGENGLTPSLQHQGPGARRGRDPEPVAWACPEEPPTEIPRAQDPRPGQHAPESEEPRLQWAEPWPSFVSQSPQDSDI